METELESLRVKLKSSIAGKQEQKPGTQFQNNGYNDLATTKKKTWDKIKCSSNKPEKVLIRVDWIAEAIDLFEQYSYKYWHSTGNRDRVSWRLSCDKSLASPVKMCQQPEIFCCLLSTKIHCQQRRDLYKFKWKVQNKKNRNPFFHWIKKAANIQGNVHELAFDAGWQELLDYNQLKMSCFGGQQSILLQLQPRWHPNELMAKILLLLKFLSFFVGCWVCWLRNLHFCIKRMNYLKDLRSLIKIFDLIMTCLHYNFHLVGHLVFQFSKSLPTTKFSIWRVSSFAWNVHFPDFSQLLYIIDNLTLMA